MSKKGSCPDAAHRAMSLGVTAWRSITHAVSTTTSGVYRGNSRNSAPRTRRSCVSRMKGGGGHQDAGGQVGGGTSNSRNSAPHTRCSCVSRTEGRGRNQDAGWRVGEEKSSSGNRAYAHAG
eukprot:356500-Chlamydomonas_euryale.AAC.14